MCGNSLTHMSFLLKMHIEIHFQGNFSNKNGITLSQFASFFLAIRNCKYFMNKKWKCSRYTYVFSVCILKMMARAELQYKNYYNAIWNWISLLGNWEIVILYTDILIGKVVCGVFSRVKLVKKYTIQLLKSKSQYRM